MKGNQLDAIRKAMGMSKNELAKAIGISRPTLNVRISDPSTFNIVEIEKACAALKIDKSAFFTN